MELRVRMFASLVALVGAREVCLSIPEGATADELKARVGAEYPAAAPFLHTVVCAVGEEYVPGGYTLRPGDVVALIPPVSGGAGEARHV